MEAMKMNIDGTIRAKVLQYKRDGNTLTEKWETLTKLCDGVYYNREQDAWDNWLYVFFYEDNGVFWFSQIASSEVEFSSPKAKERIISYRKNFRANLKERAKENKFINTLQIEVMRRLGEDITPLVASREAYLKHREEEERQKAEAEERAERERKEAEERRKAELLADGKEKIMANKAVTVEQIELLAEAVGYKIHIRTVGFMREKVSEAVLNADETVTVWGRKLTQRNISGTADVLREIAARIKAQEEKETQQLATPAETPQISTETAETVNVSAEGEKREEIVANCLYWDYQAQSVKERVNKLTKVTEHLYYIDGGGDYVTIARCLNGVFWEQQGNAEIHRSAFDPSGTEYETILKELCAYQTAEEFIAKEYTYRMENGWYVGEFTSEIVRRLKLSPQPLGNSDNLPHSPKSAPQSTQIAPPPNYAAPKLRRAQRANMRPNSAVRRFRTTHTISCNITNWPDANSPPTGSPPRTPSTGSN